MTERKCSWWAFVASMFCLAWAPGVGRAQELTGEPGFELALTGDDHAFAGDVAVYSGVAYVASGLATLHAEEGLDVVAELRDAREPHTVVSTVRTRSGVGGRFELRLLAPNEAMPLLFSVSVGRNGRARAYRSGFRVDTPHQVQVMLDRARYQRGETAHAWIRVEHRRTQRPIAGEELLVRFRSENGAVFSERTITTGPSGAVSLDVPLAETLATGHYMVSVGGDARHLGADRGFDIATRTVERLSASLELDESVVAPGARVTGRVRVTSPSGTAVRGAAVEVWAEQGRGEPLTRITDADGIAAFEFTATPHVSGDRADRIASARIVHSAYGTLTATAGYVVARTRWQIAARAENDALVPDVPGSILLTVTDAHGDPIPRGQRVIVRGPGLPSAGTELTTDTHGLVRLDVNVPRSAVARMQGGPCAGATASTSFEVSVETRPATSARVCVRVAAEATVAVRAASPIVRAGDDLELSIARRRGALGRQVWIEVLVGGSAVTSHFAAASESSVRVHIPEDVSGVVVVRARAVAPSDAMAPLTEVGVRTVTTGSTIAVLVRQRDAFALDMQPARSVFRVRERAGVDLSRAASTTNDPGASQVWATLVARDETQHGGESDYALPSLTNDLRAALERGMRPADELLVRAALAPSAFTDRVMPGPPRLVSEPWQEQEYGQSPLVRDPIALREEFLRRSIGRTMSALELALAGIGNDQTARARIVRTQGARSDWAPDVIRVLVESHVLAGESARTLGGEAMTPAMLEGADPSFRFDAVARRVARARLVSILSALVSFLDPDVDAAARASANQPPDRWLARMMQLGMIEASALVDPWGRPYVMRPVGNRTPAVLVSDRALGWELVSPGPDGVAGNADDVRDPFERAVPRGTVYAVTSGEDALMDRVSHIAPGAEVLAALVRAYERLGLAASEERRGGVVLATSTEALDAPAPEPSSAYAFAEEAIDGNLARPTGGSAGGRAMAMAPSVVSMDVDREYARDERSDDEGQVARRRGSRELPGAPTTPPPPPPANDPFAALSGVVRQDFPATLWFAGEVTFGADGRAHVDVPLADALTTYRLEAIAWTPTGFTTHGRVDLRVDQEATVDAPVPTVATVGETIRLPVRITNRTDANLTCTAAVEVEGDLGIDAGRGDEVTIPAHEARVVTVEVRLTRRGSGNLLVKARRGEQVLDAVRRPIAVFDDVRLVHDTRFELLRGTSSVTIDVPAGGVPRGPGELRVAVASAMFGDIEAFSIGQPYWGGWLAAFTGRELAPNVLETMRQQVVLDAYGGRVAGYAGATIELAFAAGALWSTSAMSDREAEVALSALAANDVENRDPMTMLIALAPAARSDARPSLRGALEALLDRLRNATMRMGASASNDPSTWLEVAAAVALADRPESSRGFVAEMIERSDRYRVDVGDVAWIEPTSAAQSYEPHLEPSALRALAELAVGRDERAMPFLRTLARASRGVRLWQPQTVAFAALAADRISARVTTAVDSVTFDGVALPTTDEHGTRVAALPPIGAGSHTLALALPADALALVRITARYGVPWELAHDEAPLEVTFDGAATARETRAAWALSVRNRGVRALLRPIAEISMPAGVELDEPTRQALAGWLLEPPSVDGNILRLALRPLAAGASVRIPVAARFSLGGALRGAGVSVYDDATLATGAERPVAVLVSRTVEIADSGAEPTPAEHRVVEPPPRPVPIPLPRPLAAEVRR